MLKIESSSGDPRANDFSGGAEARENSVAESPRRRHCLIAYRVAAIAIVVSLFALGGRWVGREIKLAIEPISSPGGVMAARGSKSSLSSPLAVGEGEDAKDVPRPPGARRLFSQRGAVPGQAILRYETPASPETVWEFYRATMKELGWREIKTNGPEDVLLFAKRPSRQCIVAISLSADRSRTLTTLMVK